MPSGNAAQLFHSRPEGYDGRIKSKINEVWTNDKKAF